MSEKQRIREGRIFTGSLFKELTRVETAVRFSAPDTEFGGSLASDLRQILDDLGLTDKVRIETVDLHRGPRS